MASPFVERENDYNLSSIGATRIFNKIVVPRICCTPVLWVVACLTMPFSGRALRTRGYSENPLDIDVGR
jgi:hypothetical protein